MRFTGKTISQISWLVLLKMTFKKQKRDNSENYTYNCNNAERLKIWLVISAR